MEEETPVLFVTANVGSIFEDPDTMLRLWIQEFSQTVVRLNPKFLALHCQEIGGKNYETRMQHVSNFVRMLVSSEELREYDKAEIFIDEDFSCAEHFTALGNFYFVHQSVTDVSIWDFENKKFENLNGRNVHSGNIEDVSIKEKSKFPQDFFPECKWSRKGYLRTRWNVNGSIFDLVNIHLFHDASNFVAMQAYPSEYTVTRQKALQYTLNRFYSSDEKLAPFFLFGDFNFRADTFGVIKKLTHGLNECKDAGASNNDGKVEYKDDTSEVIVTVSKKEFSHSDHQNVFVNDSGEWLKEYDREMDAFKDQLFEFPIQFLPSYPFEENSTSDGRMYMKTRCPAWCDRVLLSVSAKQLVSQSNGNNVEYGVIGKKSCMGDHKPVYLYIHLTNGAGIIESSLPFLRVCSVCKLNSSVICQSTIVDKSSAAIHYAFKTHNFVNSSFSTRCVGNRAFSPYVSNAKTSIMKKYRNAFAFNVTNVSSDQEANNRGVSVVERSSYINRRRSFCSVCTHSNNNGNVVPLNTVKPRLKLCELDWLHHFSQQYGAKDCASRSFDDEMTTATVAARSKVVEVS